MPATPEEFLQAQADLLAAYDAQTESQFVHLAEVNLLTHYLECGSGAPVVMLHGGNSFAANWAPLLKPLARHFHLYIPDLPGCGLTERVDYRVPFREHSVAFVTSFCDSIGVERASLVGNSMGGYVACAYTLAQPRRVAKLAIVGAAPLISDAMSIGQRLLSISGVNRWFWARAWGRHDLYAHPEILRPEVLRCARIASLITRAEQTGAVTDYHRGYSIRNEMGGVDTPTLFLHGDRDGFGNVESVRRIQMAMSDARLEVVRDAGHAAWYDAADECAARLVEFLGCQRTA